MINKIIPKTLEEIKIMTEGGEKLSKVKARLKKEVKEGVNAKEIDRLAEDLIFKKGVLVSVDLDIYYKGYHTDTSFSVGLEVGYETKNFLEAGETALVNAIDAARVGNRIYDISREIETVLRKNNLSPIRALVGHGIGKKLHEDPQIPCFVSGEKSKSPEIPNNATLAIEVMYCRGKGDVALSHDGWTIVTSDGTISALFEETIAVTKNGPIILT